MSEDKFYHGGGLKSVEEYYQLRQVIHLIRITEDDRQMILMALAHLACDRPGWESALEAIALKMDNKTNAGTAQMFRDFIGIRSLKMQTGLSNSISGE